MHFNKYVLLFYFMSIDSCNLNTPISSYCIINLYLCYYITGFMTINLFSFSFYFNNSYIIH